jgi:predicted dehydrogenase
MRKKILLLGCGLWGRNVLRDLLLLGCEVHAVDPDPTAREGALRSGARSAHERPPDSRPDGVIVAAPASLHRAAVESVLGYGVPVFVEKPLAVTREDARWLAGLARPPLFTMHNWRYHPAVEKLAAIARAQELGPARLLRSTRTNWTSPRTDVDPVWTLLPHDLSIALEVLGGLPRPVSARAEWHRGKPVGMLCVLEHGEALVVVEVSTRTIEKRREIALRCEGGVAVVPDDTKGWLEILRDGAKPEDVERVPWPTRPGALQRELAAFVAYLHGGEPPRCDARVGAEVVERVLTLREMAGIAAP